MDWFEGNCTEHHPIFHGKINGFLFSLEEIHRMTRICHWVHVRTPSLSRDLRGSTVPGYWSSKQALDWVDAAKGDVFAAPGTLIWMAQM